MTKTADRYQQTQSHPHGCVSWNFYSLQPNVAHVSHPHGCVSWNVNSANDRINDRRHTLTGVWVEMFAMNTAIGISRVTPSRVCELKFYTAFIIDTMRSHTLTGVWVEIFASANVWHPLLSHPHGCVSWNLFLLRHWKMYWVTPSRVCELKLIFRCIYKIYQSSHPHGCVSWNNINCSVIIKRTLSHPHGCVSWNLR